ncbi:MAG: tRNA (adenosine(37)-N6)-threonylcarbamoyltransferase complex ATPase subunit type 1 TsaE [bacterium]|nr:tRNA (adenosine(37)-N6)-threonylcarbamoyltransferase complex ATPase subunit type 1 TsaE [bacterium]
MKCQSTNCEYAIRFAIRQIRMAFVSDWHHCFMIEITTHSASQTKNIASALAKEIKKTPHKTGAFVVALEGNLGSGKTTFAQGFARGLGIKDIPKSPTFVLMNVYPFGKARHLVHIDCYRIKSSKELLHLGVKEIFKDPHSIVVIEWAERIKKILPKSIVRISFHHGKKSNERKLKVL